MGPSEACASAEGGSVVVIGLVWSGVSDETETATDGGVVDVVKVLSWISCSPLCSSAMSISIAARPSGEHLRALANL